MFRYILFEITHLNLWIKSVTLRSNGSFHAYHIEFDKAQQIRMDKIHSTYFIMVVYRCFQLHFIALKGDAKHHPVNMWSQNKLQSWQVHLISYIGAVDGLQQFHCNIISGSIYLFPCIILYLIIRKFEYEMIFASFDKGFL